MRLRKLRIAWSVVWGLAAVLLIALWVRSYWWSDTASAALRSPSMLVLYSYHGQLSIYVGEQIPYQTGWFPSGWEIESFAIGNIEPSPDGRPKLRLGYSIQKYGRQLLLPHWLLIVFLTTLASIPLLTWRFSLRTLLIATTLVAVGLGLVVWTLRG